MLDGCFLLIRGPESDKDSEYHTEMNWEVLSHWCETKVFQSTRYTHIPSVLVLDRAAYHTVLDEEDRWQLILGTRRDWLIPLCSGKVCQTVGL